MKARKKHCLAICCSSLFFILSLVCSALCISLVVVRAVYLDKVMHNQIDQQVILSEGSKGFEGWKHPPAPVYAKFHFYNLNNPEEFIKGTAKPDFTDIGPFVYREDKTKFNITFNYDQTEVGYHLRSLYYLDESMSVGDPHSVQITQVNTIIVALVHTLETHFANHKLEKAVVSEALNLVLGHIVKDSFIEKRSVHDWLWGYQDHFLDVVQKAIKEVNKLLHQDIPVPAAVVALQTNNSANDSLGWSVVYTGKGDLSKIAWYKEWNSVDHINGWLPGGGDLLGGEGILFTPGLSRNDTLYAFISQLFRSGYFTYVEDTSIYGIQLYKYSIPKAEMGNVTMSPSNAKYFSYGLSGVMNLTAVFPMNAPVFVSKPHFLDADPLFLQNLTGLTPNRSLHDSFLDVEPNTGGVLNAAKRIQINLNIQESKYFSDLKNIRNIMFPVLYAAEEGNITESLAEEFKTSVLGEIDTVHDIFVAAIVVSGVAAVFFLLLAFCVCCCHCCSFGEGSPVKRFGRRLRPMAGEEDRPLLIS